MKKYRVLLFEDVKKQGRKGEVVDVKPGFARNYLLPQGKAHIATKQILRLQEQLQKERLEQAKRDKEEAEKLAANLSGKSFDTVVRTDPDGNMYGSVTAAMIAEMITQAGFPLEKHHVGLTHPIKQIGTVPVTLHLGEGVTTQVSFTVKPDGVVKKPEAESAPKQTAVTRGTESTEEAQTTEEAPEEAPTETSE